MEGLKYLCFKHRPQVGSPVSYRRENGSYEKGTTPIYALNNLLTEYLGKIVDLKVDERSNGTTAVLQAKIR